MKKLPTNGKNKKKVETPRNPFVLPARLRQAGPLRDRTEKRLKNKQQQKEQEELETV
jgi:hypothetical protein